jgi:hypothetical protein
MKKMRISKLIPALACGLVSLCASGAAANDANLTLYVPFDNGIDAAIAAGKGTGRYDKGDAPQFADGVSGNGLVSGGSSQRVIFETKDNISTEQFTISFWVKGLPEAQWNVPGFLQTFWTIDAADGYMWLYKYTDQDRIRLISKMGQHLYKEIYAPKFAEEEWHFWSVAWRKGGGAYLFVDGKMIGRSSCERPQQDGTISIGQIENTSVQNKIIDEFKIYDKALSAEDIAKAYIEEGKAILTPAQRELPALPNAETGQIDIWSYPSLQKARLGWEVLSIQDLQGMSLKGVLKNRQGRVVKNISLPVLTSFKGSEQIGVGDIPDGEYTLDVAVSRGQKAVLHQTLNYHKKPLPEWFGNKLGISDTPPVPWTNVALDSPRDNLSIWGRNYQYDARLLPTQIINQGKAMLTSPMRLAVATEGKDAQVSSEQKSTVKWTEHSAMLARSQRQQALGDVSFTANSTTEFDGMTWLDLTVAPRGGTAKVGQLVFEIPLRKEWAELIKPYDDYLAQQAGKLSPDGWQGKALSMPWVGNGDGGIQFFLETSVNWQGSKKVEIVPDGQGNYVLRAHLIDTPFALDKPLSFSFGWIVSPVKAPNTKLRDVRLIPNWRYERLKNVPFEANVMEKYDLRARQLNPNFQTIFPWWQGWWWLPVENYPGNYDGTGTLPVINNKELSGTVDYFNQPHAVSFYGRFSEMGTANPWFEQFGDEWVADTGKYSLDPAMPIEEQKVPVSQEAQSLNDFYAWGYHQLIEKANAKSLYYDLSMPVSDSNIYRGAGAVLTDGANEPIRNIRGMRRIFQRVYTMLKEKNPDASIIYHMSGEVMLPLESFTDILADGENFAHLVNRNNNRGYENFLDVDKYRAEYAPQNNRGPSGSLIPQFERMGSIRADEWEQMGYGHADYLLGLTLLHDSHIWWESLSDEYWTKAYGAIEETGRNGDWSFVPYWHQKYFALPKGVYASIYRSPDLKKSLVILMNTSGSSQPIELPLQLGEERYSSTALVYPQSAPAARNTTTFSHTQENNSFQAILLEQ